MSKIVLTEEKPLTNTGKQCLLSKFTGGAERNWRLKLQLAAICNYANYNVFLIRGYQITTKSTFTGHSCRADHGPFRKCLEFHQNYRSTFEAALHTALQRICGWSIFDKSHVKQHRAGRKSDTEQLRESSQFFKRKHPVQTADHKNRKKRNNWTTTYLPMAENT